MTNYFSLLLVLGFSFASFPAEARSIGELAFVNGEVFVNQKKATDGMKVFEGSVVSTQEGKCSILLGKENVVHLDTHSKMKMTEFKGRDQATLDLEYGKTRALIQSLGDRKRKKFQFRSRNAVMGVRGTHIYIDSPQDTQAPQKFVAIEGEAELVFNPSPTQNSANQNARSNTSKQSAKVKPRRIQLKPGKVVQSKGEVTPQGTLQVAQTGLDSSEISEFSESVAPPPAEVQNAQELKAAKSRVGLGRYNRNRGLGLPVNLPFFGQGLDPNADGDFDVPIRVSVGRHN